MKKSRYSDSQIINILKAAEGGTPVAAICREHDMSNAAFYQCVMAGSTSIFLKQSRRCK